MSVKTRGNGKGALRRAARRSGRVAVVAAALGGAAFGLVAAVGATRAEAAVLPAALAAVGVLWLALIVLALMRGRERDLAQRDALELRRALARHRQIEADLARAERLLHAGSFHLDAATRTISCSPGMERISGGLLVRGSDSLEALITRVHGEDREFVRSRLVGALGGDTTLHFDGTVLNFHFRLVRPNGEVRIVQLRANLDRDVRGRVLALYALIQDVTGFEPGGGAEPVDSYASAFDNAAIPTALVGLQGSDRGLVVRANKAFCARLGYPPADLEGTPLAELGGPSYVSRIEEHLAELRTLGTGPSSYAIRCTRPDGELVPLRVHQAGIADADGEPRFAIVQLVERERPSSTRSRRFESDPLQGELTG